jgi:hypothetical protein
LPVIPGAEFGLVEIHNSLLGKRLQIWRLTVPTAVYSANRGPP